MRFGYGGIRLKLDIFGKGGTEFNKLGWFIGILNGKFMLSGSKFGKGWGIYMFGSDGYCGFIFMIPKGR